VFHLASLIGIPYSYHSPDSYVDTNVKGTLNLLQAARAVEAELFVHTSTSETYGNAQYVPIDEKHPASAQSPYAATKIAADQLAMSFYRSFGLPVTIVRPFNTYGPRQSARAIIPTIITQLLSAAGEVNLGSLTPTRDFSYVTDIVAGLISAGSASNVAGEVINFGSGGEIAVGELADRIAGIMNRSIKVITDSQRVRSDKSEVERLVCDASKAKRLLDWENSVTLEDGLKRTIEWFSDRNNLAGYKPERYNV
jgi:dTDP-glucose 4,6-dehydratase